MSRLRDKGVKDERIWLVSVTAGVDSKTNVVSDGHTVKGFSVACLHKPGFCAKNGLNAASDTQGEQKIRRQRVD